MGDTWVVFWGEFQFVRKLHGSCCGVYHVHQNGATAIKNIYYHQKDWEQ